MPLADQGIEPLLLRCLHHPTQQRRAGDLRQGPGDLLQILHVAAEPPEINFELRRRLPVRPGVLFDQIHEGLRPQRSLRHRRREAAVHLVQPARRPPRESCPPRSA